MRMRDTAAAELVKLRSLPAAVATVLGTVAVAIALAAGIAGSTRAPLSPEQTVVAIVPFLQIGPILLGVLAVATEYQGGQFRTTLTAAPARVRLLAAKATAYLVTATIASAAAVGGGLATAAVVLAVRDHASDGRSDGWHVAGAVVYPVMIGLLALSLAVLLRSLIPPLVAMLALVLIVSPLVGASTEHARWLPDRAGALLYLEDGDPVLTAGAGALVLLGWIAAAAITAVATFVARDA
ncbi:hypothetical protein [Microbacterium marinilacus]|uniref:ABC transporter permease n=1 Tax=Microbacterium marinilacus TaxID=415209 RepID=A0ABP7BLK3_9MICO|nr:hypothetical protein [Microbacterium marinilacus]MBY0687637.1 hypothetical protein [Microbacterium marinilacus]